MVSTYTAVLAIMLMGKPPIAVSDPLGPRPTLAECEARVEIGKAVVMRRFESVLLVTGACIKSNDQEASR